MAVYTDFIVASPDALRAAFPGWGAPLAAPARVRGRNPATGGTVEWLDWTDPDDPPDDGAPPPSLEGLRVFQTKSIDPVVVGALAQAMFADDHSALRDQLYRPALVAPLEANATLCEIPEPITSAIAALEPSARRELGIRWAALQRADAATIRHEATRQRQIALWSDEVLVEIVEELAVLCRARGRGEGLYLYAAW